MSLVHFITVHVLRQVFSGYFVCYFVCYFMTPDSEYRITGCRDTASISGSIRALIWCHSPATRLTAQTAAQWHQLAQISPTKFSAASPQLCYSYPFQAVHRNIPASYAYSFHISRHKLFSSHIPLCQAAGGLFTRCAPRLRGFAATYR